MSGSKKRFEPVETPFICLIVVDEKVSREFGQFVVGGVGNTSG
jgi:hypothetical protein